MKHISRLAITAGTIALALSTLTAPANAVGFKANQTHSKNITVDAKTKKRFDRQFRPHNIGQAAVWTRKLKAASGDPNIVVFDRRFEFGEIYECNYITHRGKRAIVCQ